jgi:hypothetical protein
MSVTDAELRQPGQGASPPAGGPGSSGRAPRRRHWRLGILGGLLALTIVVAGVLAAGYQPTSFGGASGGTFPGVPAGTGLRAVNTFGAATGDIYVPPQQGSFGVVQSIQNTGPLPVTIESVTALRPDQAPSPGIQPWPLTPAGQALYLPEYGRRPGRGSPVSGLSLRPGQTIEVAIPVRMSGACYVRAGWTGLTVFYVKERFLAFTHWVAVPLGTPLIFHEPENGAGFACPGR